MVNKSTCSLWLLDWVICVWVYQSIDWLILCFIASLIGRLIEWLIDWLIFLFFRPFGWLLKSFFSFSSSYTLLSPGKSSLSCMVSWRTLPRSSSNGHGNTRTNPVVFDMPAKRRARNLRKHPSLLFFLSNQWNYGSPLRVCYEFCHFQAGISSPHFGGNARGWPVETTSPHRAVAQLRTFDCCCTRQKFTDFDSTHIRESIDSCVGQYFSKNKFNELIFSAQRLSVCLSYPREILSRLVLFSLFSKCLLFPQEYQIEFPAHLQPPAHMAILNGAVRTRKVTSPGTPVGEDGRVIKTFPETSAGDVAIVAEVTHAGINCFVCGKKRGGRAKKREKKEDWKNFVESTVSMICIVGLSSL